MRNLVVSIFVLIFGSLTGFFLDLIQLEAANTDCRGVFPDMAQGELFCPYGEYLYHQNIINGYSDGKFSSNSNLTRGQLAKIIKTAFQIPTDTSGNDFPDVAKGNTFYSEIKSLKNAGIISGNSQGNYMPESPVSRDAMMKFILNASRHKSSNAIPSSSLDLTEAFPDVPTTNTFYEQIRDVYAYSQNITDKDLKIINGYSDGKFNPSTNVTRGQTAKILTNTIKALGIQTVECSESFCQDKFTGPIVTQPDTNNTGTNHNTNIDNPSICYGMIQNIFSPDDPNLVYMGRAVVKVNTQQNTLYYWIGAGGYSSSNTVTLHWGSKSQTIPLTKQENGALIYEGTVNYEDSDEEDILNGDLKQNYFQFPVQTNPQINGYAYFGSNFTPTECDTELFPTSQSIPGSTPESPVVWMATHESATADEWRINENTEPAQDSNYCSRPLGGITDEVAHGGKYALKMMIDTTIHHAGCRTFRYPEAQSGQTYYYSAWFYLPEKYIVYGTDPSGTKVSGWTNLMQFKAKKHGQTGGSTLFWSVGASNRPDGTMYLFTKWDKNENIPGPSIDYLLLPNEDRQFHQDEINIYPKQWFHLEMMVKQNTLANYNGRVTVWQDGVQIFDMDNVVVRQPYLNPLQPPQLSWSVNSYGGVVVGQDPANSKSLFPRNYTVYVDDAVVSTERIGP